MRRMIDMIKEFVFTVKDQVMPDKDFFKYLKRYPDLIKLISASRREGNATVILINESLTVFKPKRKDVFKAAVELNEQMREFSLWLITAGKIFGFTVLGIAPIISPEEKAQLTKEILKKADKHRFEEGSKLDKAHQKLLQKIKKGLVRFIYEEHEKGLSFLKISKRIKTLTRGVSIHHGNLSGLLKRFGLND